LALHPLRQAIDPPLALAATMANWNTLAVDLAESSRKRVPPSARVLRAVAQSNWHKSDKLS